MIDVMRANFWVALMLFTELNFRILTLTQPPTDPQTLTLPQPQPIRAFQKRKISVQNVIRLAFRRFSDFSASFFVSTIVLVIVIIVTNAFIITIVLVITRIIVLIIIVVNILFILRFKIVIIIATNSF